MESLGEFNAALNSIRASQTNALVNVGLELNIFTKRLVQPPVEYAGVGQHLAPSRRKEAQDGTRHAIARKLGLLFRDKTLLPHTPELIRAYGTRSSEIARSSAANPQGNSSHGAFAELIGADATTLWAAATSGWTSIQCHLLACLLARIWESPEATSIWVEIVAARKEELKKRLAQEGELEHEMLFVVNEEISRNDLLNWDASARAWLRVADKVMAKQQTQVRLIVDNLSLSVNAKPDTYESVMEAWSSAMIQMEKLLLGVPLQVNSGDILLGLVSWHLYPDMEYLSTTRQTIGQKDPLLEGRGLLTVGLEPSPRINEDHRSLYWSLPLSHLRYYGRLPVSRTQSFRTTDHDRVTIDELLWAMICTYIQPWDDGSVPTRQVLEFVSDIALKFQRICLECLPSWNNTSTSWLRLLGDVCTEYKDKLDEPRVRRLRMLGQRSPTEYSPFHGVFNLSTYLRVSSSLEDKIHQLRNKAIALSQELGSGDYEFLIVYGYPPRSEKRTPNTWFEFATVRPERTIRLRDENQSPQDQIWKLSGTSPLKHRRWILNSPGRGLKEEQLQRQAEISGMGEDAEGSRVQSSLSPFNIEETLFGPGNKTTESVVVETASSQRYRERRRDRPRPNFHDDNRTLKSSVEDPSFEVSLELGSRKEPWIYTRVIGDVNNIALLRRQHRVAPVIHQHGKSQRRRPDEEPSVRQLFRALGVLDIMRLFTPGSVSLEKCAQEMRLEADHNKALLGMTFIRDLYQDMEGATVDVRAIKADFRKALWVKTALETQGYAGARSKDTGNVDMPDADKKDRMVPALAAREHGTSTCFACIAMMETGSYNLNPAELQSVFALCSAESLYIATALLKDPAASGSDGDLCLVRRYTGSIGRAGMAFLVPPKQPEIRSYDHVDEWHRCDHNQFDGVMEDHFTSTSLHLSFSQASQAVNIEFSGGRDVEAYFLETLISVYDKEAWIAELDVLEAMKSQGLVRRFLQADPCTCSATGEYSLIAVDSYAEMLIPPKKWGVIRAEGNWQARLAAASICLAAGYKVVLKPKDTCWICLQKGIKLLINEKIKLMII